MEVSTVQHEPVSVGDWVVTIIISIIPLVNIVMLLVWAFGSNTNPSKANWAKAYLAFVAIFFVLGVIIALSGGSQIN